MLQIRRIAPHEWLIAKRIIYRVAYTIFNVQRPLEELIEMYEAKRQLEDMDDIQKNYFERGGIFLVTTLNDEIIGTGALRQVQGDLCELKRFWLLTEYHGQGLGYRMWLELASFARDKGYRRIQLETDAVAQHRAVEFYKRIGFREIPIPNQTPDEDILMEMEL